MEPREVTLDDSVVIATPEGIELTLSLAGVGSRFVAAAVDLAITTAMIVAFFFALGLGTAGLVGDAGPVDAGLYGIAILLTVIFLINFFYAVLFEVWANGKTPGKRWTGLRVVSSTGGPVGFRDSMIRNLIRFVDALPAGYVVGIVAILVSRRNQRLGDMFAGTLVILDRPAPAPVTAARPLAPPGELPPWDTSTVTAEELATVRAFLERRATLTPQARWQLAWELSERLRPKVAGAPADHPEVFLERLVAIRSARV